MNLPIAINSIFGSCLVLCLIIIDYVGKYNTDSSQRFLFLTLLLCTIISIGGDFFYFAFEGSPGWAVHVLLIVVLNIYYIFQVVALYLLFVFIDHLMLNDKTRTEKVLFIVKCVMAFHLLILVLNFRFHFYFSVSEGNRLIRGSLYIIRLVISYVPMVSMLFELLFFIKQFKRIQIYLIVILFVLTGLGSVLDIVLNTGGLIWPCFSSALLCTYFFIIRADFKTDTLTGIGNRYAFNEFINSLSRQTAKQAYSIVMIDMDHFKKINDTLGHIEGDNALRDMAAIIKGNIRGNDFAARYGGDEFVLAAKADSDVSRIMERIQEAMDNQNSKGTRPYKIEISYGMDVFTPNSNQSIGKFLAHIDSLMYKHKAERQGRRHTDNPPEIPAAPAS